MKILALEFSSEQRSVAVLERRPASRPALHSETVETGGRATRALGLIERALNEAGWEREEIECLAVGLGPGSYAGIRVAIALAQGWQLARAVKLIGISSVACLAAQAQAQGWFGSLILLVDAQRNEFYCAHYAISSVECQAVQPMRLATLAEIQTLVDTGNPVAGPEVARWFPAGRRLFPSAAMIGQLAAERTDFVSGEQLEPIYLRPTCFVKAPPPRIIPGL